MSAANLGRSKIDRGQQPGLLDPLRQPRREAGRASIAGFQTIQRHGQIFCDARLVHFESSKNCREIGIGPFDQL
jgi:hypothetical protein